MDYKYTNVQKSNKSGKQNNLKITSSRYNINLTNKKGKISQS